MVLSTAHLLLGFVRAVQAFSSNTNPENYYSDFGSPIQTVKSYLFIAQTLLGDGVMIWRCYVVYNNSKVVLLLSAVPITMNITFGVMGAIRYIQHKGDLLEQNSLYLSTFIAVTLAVNITCSAAVVYQIWRTSKEMQDFRKVFPLLSAIIQSGALYATTILATLISYVVKSNGVYTALDAIVPLVGIVFSLIVLQIHFHLHMNSLSRNNAAAEHTSNLPTLGTLPRWRHYFSNTPEQCQAGARNGIPDPRYQLQRSSIYSREDIDIDRVSMSSDIDTRIKEANRVLPQR